MVLLCKLWALTSGKLKRVLKTILIISYAAQRHPETFLKINRRLLIIKSLILLWKTIISWNRIRLPSIHRNLDRKLIWILLWVQTRLLPMKTSALAITRIRVLEGAFIMLDKKTIHINLQERIPQHHHLQWISWVFPLSLLLSPRTCFEQVS